MCSLCFSAGLFGLSNVPSAVKPSPSSSSTSPWTKKAGYTDSICCSKDNPVANCGTSGMIGYILIFYINIIYYISVTNPDRGSPDIYLFYLAVSVSESV